MKNSSTSKRCWRFAPEQLEQTPSRACGVDAPTERALRRAGCAQIIDMATRYVCPQPTRITKHAPDSCVLRRLFGETKMRGPATTACLLYQRFYARHSFTRVERTGVASSCLFLAAKVEEMHRKLKDIVIAEYASQNEGAKVRLISTQGVPSDYFMLFYASLGRRRRP